jgi:fibronectin-binding autotransporter adhesin
MKNLASAFLIFSAAFALGLNAQATAYTWKVAAGSAAWNSASSWTAGSGFPSAAGDVANITNTLTAATTVSMTAGETVGIINIGSNANFGFLVGTNGSSTLTLNNSAAGAQINLATTGTTGSNNNTIASPIIIADTGGLTITAGGGLGRSQSITGGITSTGTRSLTITDNRTGGSNATPFQITTNGSTNVGINNTGSITVNSNQTGVVGLATVISANIGSNVTSLTKAGSGLLLLSGTNSYTGTTSIANGTLSASNIVVSGGSSNLGNATSAVLLGSASSSGTLSYTGNSATYTRGFTVGADGGEVDTTASGQTLTIATGNINNTSGGLITFGGAGNTTVTSVIGGGNGGLVQTGAGVLTLSGSNSYSGGTTINTGGTLLVNNTSGSATGSGSFALAAGAGLGGTGAINSSTFALGASGTAATVVVGNGTDTTSGLTLTGSGATGANTITNTQLTFNLNVASTQANILSVSNSGIAFSGTTLELNMVGVGVVTAFTPYELIAGTSNSQYTGFSTFVNGLGQTEILAGGGLSFNFEGGPSNSWYQANSYLIESDGDIDVVVVPEPGTWALMIGGLAALVFIQRRKRRGTQPSDSRR